MPCCNYLAFGDYFLREAVIRQLINYSNNHNFFLIKTPSSHSLTTLQVGDSGNYSLEVLLNYLF